MVIEDLQVLFLKKKQREKTLLYFTKSFFWCVLCTHTHMAERITMRTATKTTSLLRFPDVFMLRIYFRGVRASSQSDYVFAV